MHHQVTLAADYERGWHCATRVADVRCNYSLVNWSRCVHSSRAENPLFRTRVLRFAVATESTS